MASGLEKAVYVGFAVLDYYGPMTSPKRLQIPALLLTLALSCTAGWAEDDVPVNSNLSSSLMYELLLAEISASNGDNASAYQLMLDAAQKDRSDQLYQHAVELALRARAGESALQAAQAWARALPTSREANRYLLQILIGLNKLPETVEPIKRDLANRAPSERTAAISMLPRYFARASDKKLAAKVVEQALGGELSSPVAGAAAYAAIGTLRLLAEDGNGALDAAKKGAALNPKADEPVQLALILMDPKLPDAEALVSNYFQTQQSAAPLDMQMAYVRRLLDLRRFSDAYALSQRITAATPAYADAWLVRGSLALQDKQLDDAQSALSTYVGLRQAGGSVGSDAEADKGLSQAYFLLADIAEQQQKPAEAERYLALIDNPQDALRVRIRRAVMLANQGKLTEARAMIRTAPENVPEDARNKINAEAQLLRDAKEYELVYRFLREAVQGNPTDVDLRYDLAMAAEKLDKMDEMEMLLRQVIAEKPDYHHAYNALGYSLADRKLRLPEARALIKKALELAPNDPFILDSLGWVEFRSGNLRQALDLLQTAFEGKQDAEIAAHLGEVMWNLGQQEQARALWQSSHQQSPDNDTLNETIKRLDTL